MNALLTMIEGILRVCNNQELSLLYNRVLEEVDNRGIQPRRRAKRKGWGQKGWMRKIDSVDSDQLLKFGNASAFSGPWLRDPISSVISDGAPILVGGLIHAAPPAEPKKVYALCERRAGFESNPFGLFPRPISGLRSTHESGDGADHDLDLFGPWAKWKGAPIGPVIRGLISLGMVVV